MTRTQKKRDDYLRIILYAWDTLPKEKRNDKMIYKAALVS